MYSAEFRREVLKACDGGEGTRAVATRFNVSESWVRRIKQERREQGKLAPLKTKKRTPQWAVHAEQIVELIRRTPDLTLGELREQLQTALSKVTLCRALRQLRLTLKKSTPGRRATASRRGAEARSVACRAARPRSGKTRIPR
jgi:transposase